MKNFLVEESERIEILKRHRLLSEQTNNSRDIIQAGISAGCFGQKGSDVYFGMVESPKGSGNYVFQKGTNDATMKNQGYVVVRIRPDNTYYYVKPGQNGQPSEFTQPRPLPKPCAAMANFGKKTEQELDNEYKISLAKKGGFAELPELRAKGEDTSEITDPAVWETKGPFGNVTLYKRIGTTSGGMNQTDAQRNAWITKLDQMGYSVNPENTEKESMIPVKLYGQKIPGLPEGLFPAEQIVYIKKGQTSGSRLSQSEKDSDVDRGTCKNRIENFYNKFMYSKGRPITDISTLNIAKDEAQFCKNKYEGKWGIGGGKFDDMIALLSGRKSGGPSSSGDDSIFRLQ